MVTLSDDKKSIEINGRTYNFKEPVFAVHIAHAEWHEKLVATLGNSKELEFYQDSKKLKAFCGLWGEYLRIVFENPDESLKAEVLTPRDIQRIQLFFLASSLSPNGQSEHSESSEDSSPTSGGSSPTSPTDGR